MSQVTAGPAAADPLSAPITALTGGAAIPRAGRVVQKGLIRSTPEGIFWTCPRCDTENQIESESCTVCGLALAAAMRPPEKERPVRDPGAAAMISLVLPGAGHAYLGQWGQAAARGVIALWVSAVVALTLIQGSGMGGVAMTFGAAAIGLWLVSAHDAYREAKGQRGQVILKGRAFMWVTLALLLLLMVVVTASAVFKSPDTAPGPGVEEPVIEDPGVDDPGVDGSEEEPGRGGEGLVGS